MAALVVPFWYDAKCHECDWDWEHGPGGWRDADNAAEEHNLEHHRETRE
jgi:hypothetical protein